MQITGIEPKVVGMKEEEIDLSEYSNKALRRLKMVFNAYGKHLGLDPMSDRFTAKMHVVRICNTFPTIKDIVRPDDGPVTRDQCARLHRYMVKNPLPGITVSPDAHLKGVRRIYTEPGQIHRVGPAESEIKEFYRSWEWKQARYRALKKAGGRCRACGAVGAETPIVVDHIKPVRHYWDRRLDQKNLQVLCRDCNMGKGSWDRTDWSRK